MPYETIDEAIEIANGTRYGLGASVFGPDQGLCIQVAKKLECGMVSVNDFATFYVRRSIFLSCKASTDYSFIRSSIAPPLFLDAHIAHVPDSVKIYRSVAPRPAVMADLVRTFEIMHCADLISSSGGPEGLRALTNPKAIMVDRWPSLIQTSIPKVLDYPIRQLGNSWCVDWFFLSNMM